MATSTLGSGTLVLAGTTSGTTTVTATAVAGTTTLTLPAATDTLVGKATTDTLTNKTLGAVTLGGTVAGGGNQINNVIIGTTNPLAGSFTTVSATPSGVTNPVELRNLSNFPTYGAIAFNSAYASTTILGFYAGASGDTNLHINAPTTKSIFHEVAGATVTTTSSAGLAAAGSMSVGGATPTTSGAGITFPATQNASSNANTLDDYEEGTWTPSLGGTATYIEQLGSYTKIGNFVKIRFHLHVNVLGTGSTTTITGIPFNPSSTQPTIMGGVVTYINNLATAALAIGVYAQSGSIFFMTRNSSSTGATTQGPAVIGNSFDVYAEISYMV
jgi:hypothetical protein